MTAPQPPYDPAKGQPASPQQYPSQPDFGAQPQYGAPQQPYGSPAQPPYGAQQPYGAPVAPSDARTWAMLAHLGGIVLGFIAPLIVWVMYKDRDEFVRRHAVHALNFHILLTISLLVSSVLIIVVIGLLLFPVVWIAGIVFSILAGIAANKGQEYKYPINLSLVK
jgi:uncharacterized protein